MLDRLNTSANKAIITAVLLPLSQIINGLIKYGAPEFHSGFWTANEAAIWAFFGAIGGLLVYIVPNRDYEHVDPKTEVVVDQITLQPTKEPKP